MIASFVVVVHFLRASKMPAIKTLLPSNRCSALFCPCISTAAVMLLIASPIPLKPSANTSIFRLIAANSVLMAQTSAETELVNLCVRSDKASLSVSDETTSAQTDSNQ
eukprot:11001609-Karenia_brevis.AAC.1